LLLFGSNKKSQTEKMMVTGCLFQDPIAFRHQIAPILAFAYRVWFFESNDEG